MSLRYKIGLTALLVASVYVAAAYFIQHDVIEPSFQQLEMQEAREDARRYVTAIQREIEYLHDFNEDWSVWDDTYTFAEDGNQAFIDANLELDSWYGARIDFMYVYNKRGELLWGAYIDHQARERVRSDVAITKALESHASITRPSSPSDYVEGLIFTERGPALLSSQPIVTSGGEGPVNGAMIIGSMVNADFENELLFLLGQPVYLRSIHDTSLTEADRTAMKALSNSGTEFYVTAHSPQELWCYTFFRDVNDQPALLIRNSVERDIVPVGRVAARVAFLSTLGAGFVLIVFMVLNLHRSVARPLALLTQDLTAIADTKRPSLGSLPARTDEIGMLAREFELMMSRLEEGTRQRASAEDALRNSEARMRAILDSAPDAILTLDANGRIESANPAVKSVFGYDPECLATESIERLIPEFLDSASGSGHSRECSGLTKDGQTVPLFVTNRELLLAGKQMRLVIAKDISELRKAYEQLRRQENLAMLGEMGASLAHEIKNPLAGISGAIQVLRDGLSDSDPRREIIDEIITQVDRLDQSVRDLLMFARPWTPEMTQSNVRTLIDSVIAFSRGREEFRGIRIETGAAGFDAVLDPVLLRHVLNNVFDNAAHAMAGTGTIHISATTSGDEVVLSVRDTGPGMPGDIAGRAFQPFFTTKSRGTGLGLTVSRTIIEAHGGTIQLNSEPGAGTTVLIRLPAGRPAADGAAP